MDSRTTARVTREGEEVFHRNRQTPLSSIPQRASRQKSATIRASSAQVYSNVVDDEYAPDAHRYVRTTTGKMPVRTTDYRIRQSQEPELWYEDDEPIREKSNKGFYTLVFSTGALAFLILMLVGSFLISWGTDRYNDMFYGSPTRVTHLDAYVGHPGEDKDHMTHFMAMNANGKVAVIEIPAQDTQHIKVYASPPFGLDPNTPPIITFQDMNGDGKVDMVVSFGSNRWILYNDGTQFLPLVKKPTV